MKIQLDTPKKFTISGIEVNFTHAVAVSTTLNEQPKTAHLAWQWMRYDADGNEYQAPAGSNYTAADYTADDGTEVMEYSEFLQALSTCDSVDRARWKFLQSKVSELKGDIVE